MCLYRSRDHSFSEKYVLCQGKVRLVCPDSISRTRSLLVLGKSGGVTVMSPLSRRGVVGTEGVDRTPTREPTEKTEVSG